MPNRAGFPVLPAPQSPRPPGNSAIPYNIAAGSPDVHHPDYSIWGILDKEALSGNPKNVAELKVDIARAFRELPQETAQKAIMQFARRLQLRVDAAGEGFGYKMKWARFPPTNAPMPNYAPTN